MKEARIIVNTTMSKEDYRKFLYTATFRRNKALIPLLLLISLIGSFIISLDGSRLNIPMLLLSWILLFLLAVAAVMFKVERKNARRIKTDKTGSFDSTNTLKFYEDRIVFENKELKSYGELKYDQFFTLLESKDYFIFYLNMNQASLVRKKDIENLPEFKEFIVEKFGDKYRKV